MGGTDGLVKFDVRTPYWDQSTFLGRFKHFAWLTDVRNCFATRQELDTAEQLVQQCRDGNAPPGTSAEAVYQARKLYTSSFHPDSGEKQNLIGRMCFQVPGGMLIGVGLLQFYKSNIAVVSWQFINQSFNALVNYTNRNAASDTTPGKLLVAYVSATTTAVVVSLGLKSYLTKKASSLLQRWVPFVAVAAANMVNIPLMRQSELLDGIVVCDEYDAPVTKSRYAAVKGISQVFTSRIAIYAPCMLVTPMIMERIEPMRWMQRIRSFHVLIQCVLVGGMLLVSVPAGCALFPQKCSIPTERLSLVDATNYKLLKEKYSGNSAPERLYFNKGL